MWPEAVDHLASAVRAGLSLPEALTQLGARGPEPLRAAFDAFGRDYQATGRFSDCLDRLKQRLSDPVGDRVVEALRIAREVGGGDLGRMLRSLALLGAARSLPVSYAYVRLEPSSADRTRTLLDHSARDDRR